MIIIKIKPKEMIKNEDVRDKYVFLVNYEFVVFLASVCLGIDQSAKAK